MGLYVETKYADALRFAARHRPAPVGSVSRRPAPLGLTDWLEREFRTGGCFHRYLEQERATTQQKIRQAAVSKWRRTQALQGMPTRRKSALDDLEFRELAEIPARLYHRWKQTDRHFWDDPKNLKSLARDNADLAYLIKR